MKTKIRGITAISQPGVKFYDVGEVYNDLLLDRIEDRSIEFPDSYVSLYVGLTADGANVFVLENAPIDVQYAPEKDKTS